MLLAKGNMLEWSWPCSGTQAAEGLQCQGAMSWVHVMEEGEAPGSLRMAAGGGAGIAAVHPEQRSSGQVLQAVMWG